MDRCFNRAAGGLYENQSRQPRLFIEQVISRQVAKAKMLPPHGLLFPSMPVKHVCKEPTTMLLGVSLRNLHGHIMRQPPYEHLDFLLPVGQILTWVAIFRLGARDSSSGLYQLRPQFLQPFLQSPRRKAIVAVVTLNGSSGL